MTIIQKKVFEPFKIVIIDDDKGILNLMKSYLKDVNWESFFCETGNQGLLCIEEVQPDVVFLDIQLPDITGIEVLKKCHHKYPDTKFVMITGMSDREEILSQTRHYGAVTCLIKPFEKKYFLNTLDMITRMLSLERTPPKKPEIRKETTRMFFWRRSKEILLDPLVLFWIVLVTFCIIATLLLCFIPNFF